MIEIKLYICDSEGSCKQTVNLYKGTDKALAQAAYEASAMTIEYAARTKVLRVVWLEHKGCTKAYDNLKRGHRQFDKMVIS